MESMVNQNFENFYKGKKIFLTGHTGFKGAWLVTWLHTMGAQVKGYALASESEDGLFNKMEAVIAIDSVIADIRDKEKLAQAISDFQPDIIFHLAAQAFVRRSYQVPSETFEINVIGTTNLLEAASKLPHQCTIVVITTDKVYANREIDYHYKEDDILGGYDPYSASKAAAEIAVDSFRNSFFNVQKYNTHKKALASARAGNVIGGGDFSKDRIIPDIIAALKNNEPVAVRNQFAVRPWQHVLEPLSGYLQLAMLLSNDAPRYSGAYNFGPMPEDHLPVKDLVDIAIKCWGQGSWADHADPAQPHEAGLLQLDITKAIDHLNWQPKLQSSEAIQWTIDWYRQPADSIVAYTFEQIQNYQQK
jgi:CDP-glucose 4,6-dehydratase